MIDPQAYDVVIVSDLRFPGGSSASIAEEIKAQAGGGLRTGLVHVDSPIITKAMPVNPRIQALVDGGLADLLATDAETVAGVAVLRHPGVFEKMPAGFPSLRADHLVLVANQVPDDGTPHHVYDPAVVHRNVAHLTGYEPLWAPISDRVRRSLLNADRLLPLTSWNWVNVIDPGEWGESRTGMAGERPVIGRHSRPSVLKWPEDPERLRAAYPTDGSSKVRILGGGKAVESLLGSLPPGWDVLPFGSVEPADFLRTIDFFVYQHHSSLVEAFGRAVLEALASGAVAVVPPELASTFGSACLYAEPEEVRGLVADYAADANRFATQSARGHETVRRRFSYEVHLRRLAFLRGQAAPVPARTGVRSPTRTRPIRPLFVCTNGVGVGHLNRVSAIARRSSEWTRPVILTMCTAVQIPEFAGVEVEWFPTPAHSGLTKPQWNNRFGARLDQLIELHDSDIVVFDGAWPFKGLLESRGRHPDLPFVWCRRGGSKQHAGDATPRARRFDVVIVPGEMAGDEPTPDAETNVVSVGPILLVDDIDVVDPVEAKLRLGLDPELDAVLVQLGAGNINNIGPLQELVVQTLRRQPHLQICVSRSAISDRVSGLDCVVEISEYPLSRLYSAFMFAVTACGYNTFHEVVACGLPTLTIPNTSTITDDQDRRAALAAKDGIVLYAHPDDPPEITRSIETLFDPEVRRSISTRCAEVFPGNGATDAMLLIEELALRRRR